MNFPKVSVVIPTYNHQCYILAALDSVFAQTFTDFEIIVVNDGSPDNTAEVLRPLTESGRIRYIEQKNQGQSAARNRGISEAKGEFIALLDDDDIWPPDKLQWQVEELQNNPDTALVYGSVSFIDDNGECIQQYDAQGVKDVRLARIPQEILAGGATGDVYEQFLRDNYIISPGLCLIRLSALKQLGETAFDPNIQGGADDWDLYLSLSKKHPFLFQQKEALCYRVHASNASRDSSKILQSIVLMRQKIYRTQTNERLKHEQHLLHPVHHTAECTLHYHQ